MITLLTTTGGRPIPFSLCQRWMEAQTYVGEVRWIIVDDCLPATPVIFNKVGWTIEVISPTPVWQEGENTQARNLIAGLEVIGEDESVVIIEDDDYYAPTYLETIAGALRRSELVGERGARYFNVANDSYKYCGNKFHASLCTTAMRGDALSTFRKVVVRKDKFIDITLWRTFRGKKHLLDTTLSCGIKGMPGRGGIGMGHKMEGLPRSKVLRQWIGADARWYGKG